MSQNGSDGIGGSWVGERTAIRSRKRVHEKESLTTMTFKKPFLRGENRHEN